MNVWLILLLFIVPLKSHADCDAIPRSVNRCEFGQRESSRGSIDRKARCIPIQLALRSSNPGALAPSKFTHCDRAGYECPPQIKETEENLKWKMRAKAIEKIDQLLSVTMSAKQRSFPLAMPLQEQKIEVNVTEVKEFVEKYGYFSTTHPIVANVAKGEKDLELVCCLLKTLYEKGLKGESLKIAVAEVITKILAYRDLKVGQKIHIPLEIGPTVSYELFTVDKVFDIWGGMPAFGLIPERQGLASILLFRGTDFTLLTQRGWASIMSDLDITGPGLFVFKKSKDEISLWLGKVMQLGKRAQAMGFSLGGAMAAYTYIYLNALTADQGSLSFCAPGVADEVADAWNRLPANRKEGYCSYVNEGDVVSKVGHLFGPVYCLIPPGHVLLKPIKAHTFLMSSFSEFTKAKVKT